MIQEFMIDHITLSTILKCYPHYINIIINIIIAPHQAIEKHKSLTDKVMKLIVIVPMHAFELNCSKMNKVS